MRVKLQRRVMRRLTAPMSMTRWLARQRRVTRLSLLQEGWKKLVVKLEVRRWKATRWKNSSKVNSSNKSKSSRNNSNSSNSSRVMVIRGIQGASHKAIVNRKS